MNKKIETEFIAKKTEYSFLSVFIKTTEFSALATYPIMPSVTAQETKNG